MSIEEAKKAAVKYLYSGMKTACEVRKNLEKKEYTEEETDAAVDYLLELKYLDDEEYCRHYIEYSQNKGRGLVRIRQELKSNKGVDPEIIKKTMDEYEYPQDEMTRAFAQAEKVLEGRPFTQKAIDKVGRRLAYLGYDMNTTMHVVHEYQKKKRREEDQDYE